MPSTLETLKTTYAPGETAVLHLVGLAAGERVAVQVVRTDGAAGTPQAGPTWLVTDGGTGDFDHTADGQITFHFRVPTDATNATFQITATSTLSRSTAQITLQGDGSSGDTLDNGPAPPQTTTTVGSSAASAASGQAVTFTATVTSGSVVNEGQVQFLVDGFDIGDPVPVVNGQATSAAINSLTVASHTVTAVYADDGGASGTATSGGTVGQAEGDASGFDTSEGSLTQLVTGTPVQNFTLAWVEVQPQDVAPGQFATVLAGAFQSGETVDFQITNLTNGHAYAPFSVTDGGSNDLDGVTDGHVQTTWQVPVDALDCQLQITATGETSGLTAAATFADAQLTTTTTLTSSANPSTYGNSVTFTATVTASSTVNTGTVTFLDGATPLATVNVSASGIATFATAALTAGGHTITANYNDGTSFANSSASLSQTVNQRTLLITANPANKTEGNTLTFAGTEFTTAGAVNTRGLVNGNTVTSVTLTSAGAAAAAEDGSYAIVPSAAVGTGLSNYAITYVPGTLTVLEPAITVTATPLAAVNEGDPSAPVEVATFTHANGVEAPGHFTATVDWGVAGHHADPGTITQDGGGTYHVSAVRPVFAEQGTFTAAVTVSDNDAGANIARNFAGVNTFDIAALNGGGFFIPPDQGSAVGPNHYVEAVNLAIVVYNKDGTIAVPRMTIGSFLANAGLPGLGNSLSDPRIVYDPASSRWFFVIITTESNSNSIVVAVSQTSDPTGAWKATKFVANTIPNNFADFPTIAVDANALYVASNNFLNGATFDGVSLTSIPKADLLNPAGPVVANRTHFDNLTGGGTAGTSPFTFAPVSDFEGRDHGVIIATDHFTPATVLHSYSVLNPGSNASTLSADSPITVPTYWNNQNGHEPNGTRTLNSGDFRIGQNNVYQVGNVIWAAQSILPSSATGNGAYDAIRWYEIDATTDTLLQSGTISDPHHDYLYPAIAANAAGDVVISFSATGDATTTDFPGAWYVAGTTTGGVTTFGAPTDLRNGSSNYSIVGSGRNRWGDFGAVSVDPNNPNAFWMANETAIPGVATLNALWGTQVSEIVFGNTASASAALAVNEPAINGASATLPAVKTGQASAAVEVATFTHANGVEPAGDFMAVVDWGVAGHHADPGMVTEDGGGTYHVSATRPVFTPGTYTVNVSISEDNASTTVTDSQEVDKADTTTTVVSSLDPSVFGQSVTFTATVTVNSPGSDALGDPTGTVTFYDNGVAIGTGTLSGTSTDTATFTTNTLTVGTHPITAAYTSGDANFNASPQSAVLNQVVAINAGSIYVLNPTATGSLTLSGNGAIHTPGDVVVDSGAASAVLASGNAAVTSASVQVEGGVSDSGNAHVVKTGTPLSTADPLALAPIPASGTFYGAVSASGNTTLPLQPGIYTSIRASGNATLVLAPGVYYIQGGGFTVTGNASVSGNGVLIYNTVSGSSSGGITLSGNGSFSLKPFYASGPYANVLIFQPAANTRALSLSGNAMVGITGIVYAPTALLNVSGNGQLGSAAHPISVVVNTLNLSGNASLAETAAGSDGAGDLPGIADTLLAGNLAVYVDNSAGYFTADELARIRDAVGSLDTLLTPYNVSVTLVGDPAAANFVLNAGTTSGSGDRADGVLGCFNPATSQITIIEGWDWYAGADPAGIGANQYDFETTVMHEFGHAIGLGGATDTNSPMFEMLPTGTARRTMTVPDLNIPYPPQGADPLTAAGFRSDEGAAAPAAVAVGDQAAAAAVTGGRSVAAAGTGDLRAEAANVILVSVPGAAPSFAGATGDRLAPALGFGQVVTARPGSANLPAALDGAFFMAGSADPGSEPSGDGTTPADATEPVLIDTIFRDWGASPQGPGGPSQAEARASRATAVYAAAPADAAAGVSGFGSGGPEAMAAWGVTDARSADAFPDAPAWTCGGVAPAGGMLGAVTAATAVATLTDRGRPLPGRARPKRVGLPGFTDELPEG